MGATLGSPSFWKDWLQRIGRGASGSRLAGGPRAGYRVGKPSDQRVETPARRRRCRAGTGTSTSTGGGCSELFEKAAKPPARLALAAEDGVQRISKPGLGARGVRLRCPWSAEPTVDDRTPAGGGLLTHHIADALDGGDAEGNLGQRSEEITHGILP